MTTQSDAHGEFSFNPVAIGEYKITVHRTGFDDSQQIITIASDTSPVLHFQLALSTVSQSVTVRAKDRWQRRFGDSHDYFESRRYRANSRRRPHQQPGNDHGLLPGAYFTHDQLHIRGGHQVKLAARRRADSQHEYREQSGPADRSQGCRLPRSSTRQLRADTATVPTARFDLVPRSGFERNNEAEFVTSLSEIGTRPTTRSTSEDILSASPISRA